MVLGEFEMTTQNKGFKHGGTEKNCRSATAETRSLSKEHSYLLKHHLNIITTLFCEDAGVYGEPRRTTGLPIHARRVAGAWSRSFGIIEKLVTSSSPRHEASIEK